VYALLETPTEVYMAELLGQDMAEMLDQEHHSWVPECKRSNKAFGQISKSKSKAMQSALQSHANMVHVQQVWEPFVMQLPSSDVGCLCLSGP